MPKEIAEILAKFRAKVQELRTSRRSPTLAEALEMQHWMDTGIFAEISAFEQRTGLEVHDFKYVGDRDSARPLTIVAIDREALLVHEEQDDMFGLEMWASQGPENREALDRSVSETLEIKRAMDSAIQRLVADFEEVTGIHVRGIDVKSSRALALWGNQETPRIRTRLVVLE